MVQRTDRSLPASSARQVSVVEDHYLAVARGVNVQLDVAGADFVGGLERRHRVFRMRPAGAAVGDCARTRQTKKISIEVGSHNKIRARLPDGNRQESALNSMCRTSPRKAILLAVGGLGDSTRRVREIGVRDFNRPSS